ncbi:DISARM system SNF2-like helicase DrmD [Umezakia ovalisporum]|uniref:DISARM system SNF2-like helicase DrmD n=1 Tax=Umezakia ovalisporum TaxID=75695 RepID=UPI0035BA4FFD
MVRSIPKSNQESINPQVGMLATIRNRRALVAAVEPFDGASEGRLHLVRLEYTDSDGIAEDTIIWEREINATLLEPTALPQVANQAPMIASEFDALQRAARWTALSPFLNPERTTLQPHLPIASPFFGAIQVEDFQLVPLLKALQMPRISLLLADDVGLGKTVEAGLILTELLLRRRIRRVLILCPAALRKQWQKEIKTKFALTFDVIDRSETHALQKRLGLDANPWRTYARIITSYHYLRQPDVLEQFRAACSQPETSAQLPWDLLIVDEAHNLMPSNFGDDSDLSQMLRSISPWFEHKLFLTATPHNGHTRCFSGLLEQLDPVRFTQTSEFTEDVKRRISEVVIRRLKREINQLDEQAAQIPRFCDRIPEPIPLYFSPLEKRLSAAFGEFRAGIKSAIAASRKSEQIAAFFAVEVLNKRLLSCPYTFAQSWYRFKDGIAQQESAELVEVQAARRATLEDLDDDRETEGRLQHAAKTTGAWFKSFASTLKQEITAVDLALEELGLIPQAGDLPYPEVDERSERLLKVIKQYLRNGKEWVKENRLVIFTEYKTTLDYLERRLKETFKQDPEAIKVLFGGMSDKERDEIKQAFNNPDDPVRVLVATDAASEGLNLQETAHLVLHYDIPWNPARLDQRNGRLDRHGQARDVIVFHFTSEDNADLKFLAQVVTKVNTIREELGAMGEVFDAAFQRRFTDLEETTRVLQGLDEAVAKRQGRTEIPRALEQQTGIAQSHALKQFEQEIDLTPETLKNTLEIALGLGVGIPRFEGPDTQGRLQLRIPIPPRWESLIDDHLRLETNNGDRGALPALVFSPQHFIETRNGRRVFRPAKDTTLLHLGHPLFHQALAMFARARFPGGMGNLAVSRWILRYGEIPPQVDALLLLTVEELGVNELREPFHHWVRTLRFPIKNNELGKELPHVPPIADKAFSQEPNSEDIQQARGLWDEISLDVKELLQTLAVDLTQQLQDQLKSRGDLALKEEKERFKTRIREVQKAMQEDSIEKIKKERDKLLNEMQQLSLLYTDRRQQEERLRDLNQELEFRLKHYQELLDLLQREQERVIKNILPKKYSLRDTARVFPVTVEIRLQQSIGV